MLYVWQNASWPQWRCDFERLNPLLQDLRMELGLLQGRMEMIGLEARGRARLETVVAEAMQTSAIEGELLNPAAVRSSAARRLGLETAGFSPVDRVADGVVEMVWDAMRKTSEPLTEDRLLGWHAALFPTGYSGTSKIKVAAWRDNAMGPMRVVSGEIGRERVHYEAPPADRIPSEMRLFLEWINSNVEDLDPFVKAGRAHLWFEVLHPFEDGNGRIGRAIVEWLLAKAVGESGSGFFSISRQMERERRDYYQQLEMSSRGDLNDELWQGWFLGCIKRAIKNADEILDGVLKKAHFWSKWAGVALNVRQSAMLNKLLDGFDGKLTSSKWSKIMKCSPDTALRDLSDLVAKGILLKAEGGGRGTNYVFRDIAIVD
jgi:Fic family protein